MDFARLFRLPNPPLPFSSLTIFIGNTTTKSTGHKGNEGFHKINWELGT
jgi:hypothetical protein